MQEQRHPSGVLIFRPEGPALDAGHSDALKRALPSRGVRLLEAAAALAALALMLLILWWGWDYAVRGKVQTMAGLEELTMFWAYVAMPVGAIFSIIGIVANYLDPRHMELETAQ